MALLKTIEVIYSRLSEVPIQHGQILFCTDTNDIFMDSSDGSRVHMTDVIKLKTESEREALFVPLIGKIYLVEETNKLYKHNGTDWETISIDISIDNNDIPYSKLIPGTLEKKGVGYAPRTLASAVYLEDGKTVSEKINELSTSNGGSGSNTQLVSLKSSVAINTITTTVPINIEQFNKDTDTLFVYQNSVYLEENQDYILEDNLNISSTLDNVFDGSETEQLFNFVVLKNVVKNYSGTLDGSSIANGSITEEKLSAALILKINTLEDRIKILEEAIQTSLMINL